MPFHNTPIFSVHSFTKVIINLNKPLGGISVNLRSLKKILQGGSIKTNGMEYRSSVRA
jgi:hypothetical protein